MFEVAPTEKELWEAFFPLLLRAPEAIHGRVVEEGGGGGGAVLRAYPPCAQLKDRDHSSHRVGSKESG